MASRDEHDSSPAEPDSVQELPSGDAESLAEAREEEEDYEEEYEDATYEHDSAEGFSTNNQLEEHEEAWGQEEPMYKEKFLVAQEKLAALQAQLVDMTREKNREILKYKQELENLESATSRSHDRENTTRDDHKPIYDDHKEARKAIASFLKSTPEDSSTLLELVQTVLDLAKSREGKQRRRNSRQLSAETQKELRSLRAKAGHLYHRHRQEKEARCRAEEALLNSKKKVAALGDHIEKLMLHLKHEAASKAKAFELQRRAERETNLLHKRSDVLVKRNAARERVILEIQEGSKILEDQLRLMDEKYLELRVKLDWTRNRATHDVKKFKNEAAALRAKFALMHPGEGLLDDARVPQNDVGLAVEVGLGKTHTAGPQTDSPAFGFETSTQRKSKTGDFRHQSGSRTGAASATNKSRKKGRRKLHQAAVEFGGGLPFTIKDFVDDPGNTDAPWSDEKVSSLTNSLSKRRTTR